MTDKRAPTITPPGAPGAPSSDREVADFLSLVGARPIPGAGGREGRLIFAMDATASREPRWDQACQIQGTMFQTTAAIGGLAVQLVFYRGFGECKASKWYPTASDLLRAMTSVRCLGGMDAADVDTLVQRTREADAQRSNCLDVSFGSSTALAQHVHD